MEAKISANRVKNKTRVKVVRSNLVRKIEFLYQVLVQFFHVGHGLTDFPNEVGWPGDEDTEDEEEGGKLQNFCHPSIDDRTSGLNLSKS